MSYTRLEYQYRRQILFVRGENFVPVAISMQDWLSLCNLQTKFGLLIWRGNTSFIYSIIVIHDIAACSAVDSAMYSLLAVVRAISVCRLLNHYMGQFAYVIVHFLNLQRRHSHYSFLVRLHLVVVESLLFGVMVLTLFQVSL